MNASGTPGDEVVSEGERPVALKIFVSYRRDDAAGHAGRLFDELSERGRYDIFMDIEKIDAGLSFRDAIEGALTSCDVFLALIGSRWLEAVDANGRRRLEDPKDLVRREIEGALAREDVRVVPVLLQDTEMPASEALPAPLNRLSERHAHELSDTRWHYDVEQLVEELDAIAAKKAEEERARRQAADDSGRRDGEAAAAAKAKAKAAEAEKAELERAERLRARRLKLVGAAIAGVAILALAAFVGVQVLGGESSPEEEATPPTTTVEEPAPTTTAETTPQADPEETADPADTVGAPFPYDPTNGIGGALPKRLSFSAERREPGTIPFEAGFTGLMTDGKTALNGLFDPDAVELGDGVLRIRASSGDPLRRKNGQLNAFQFGVGPQEGPFTAHTRLPAPFRDLRSLESFESLGLFLGSGDQDNYAKLVAGAQGVEFRIEVGGKPPKPPQLARLEFPGPDAIDLYLRVDPNAATLAAWFAVADGGQTSAPVRFESRRIPRSWLEDPERGLAVGIISTTGRDGSPFEARWDLVEVTRLGVAGSR